MTLDGVKNSLIELRKRRPLVQLLTNSVVENFTANVLLALGASPVCTHDHLDSEQCAQLADALLINIGTFKNRFISRAKMTQAIMNQRMRPVVLDPVGSGFTQARMHATIALLQGGVTVVKGNRSEIGALMGGGNQQQGVDSAEFSLSADALQHLGERWDCSVIATGSLDMGYAGGAFFECSRGHPMMTRVTGMGCALGAVVAAFLASSDEPVTAMHAAITTFALAGEIAAKKCHGPGSFPLEFLDALYGVENHMSA